MTRAMCISGIVIGGLCILVGGVDLALFRASITLDIGLIVGGGMLVYLGWSALREAT